MAQLLQCLQSNSGSYGALSGADTLLSGKAGCNGNSHDAKVGEKRKLDALLSSRLSVESHRVTANGALHRIPRWQGPGEEIILAPFQYIKSMPSKGVRNVLVDSLDIWFKVPNESLSIIKKVVDLLHTSSLMFDDIEDGSTLRRGRPATHMIFGAAQTINSATYILMSSILEAEKLPNKGCAKIVTEGVTEMLLGQSHDLHSTYLIDCPQESEYLSMVDKKTGALFMIALQLMRVESKAASLPDFNPLVLMLGRYFQIRDDYMNLVSDEYAGQKGFAEDLDEGKFSYPLIHCLCSTPQTSAETAVAPKLELQNIFMARARTEGHRLTPEMKMRVLEILKTTGSLEKTKTELQKLHRELQNELRKLELLAGCDNPGLRMLLQKLKI